MDDMNDMLIAWIDFESTGLEPFGDTLPLEVGIILTDGDLDYIDDFTAVYDYTLGEIAVMQTEAPKVVYEMHHANGLWEALKTAGKDQRFGREEMDEAVLKFLTKHEPRTRHIMLGGHSMRFDHNGVEAWMPKTYAHLHYRSFDMTGLGNLLHHWTGVEVVRDDSERTPHRALDDASVALSNAIGWREIVESMSKDSEAHAAILGWMQSVLEASRG